MKEQIFHKQIVEFLNTSDVDKVVTDYGSCLEKLFKFYCKQARTDISVEL
jgi:hypothetical protein